MNVKECQAKGGQMKGDSCVMKTASKSKKKITPMILWAISILSVLGLAAMIVVPMLKEGGGSPSMLTFRLYDSNGKIIKSSGMPQSLVDSVPGVSSIDLTVNVVNTGTEALSCSLTTVTPSAFNSAITKDAKAVAVSGKASWTSSMISVAQFEGTTPTAFSVSVLCTYNNGVQVINLAEKVASLNILVESEGTSSPSFEVSLLKGGTGTEYCGDGTCSSGESAATCPADCAVANNVKFRTSDLSYVSGSALAFTTSCGSQLIPYGYSGSTGMLSGTCSVVMPSKGTALLSGLPGGWRGGGESPSLWQSADSNIVFLCDDDGSKYIYLKYDKTDSDKSKVDTTPTSFDTAKEVPC